MEQAPSFELAEEQLWFQPPTLPSFGARAPVSCPACALEK